MKKYLVLGEVRVEVEADNPTEACIKVSKMLETRDEPRALYPYELAP